MKILLGSHHFFPSTGGIETVSRLLAREFVELQVPHSEPAVIARLHAVGLVVERDYKGDSARFKVRIPRHLRAEFAPFIVQDLAAA